MPPLTSPDRLHSFLKVSLILFPSCAILGGILVPLLIFFLPQVWEGHGKSFDVFFWPVEMVIDLFKFESFGGLIVAGALSYGLLGWALGISIWGLWQLIHGHRNS